MLTLLKELNIFKCMDGMKTRNGDLFKRVSDEMKKGSWGLLSVIPGNTSTAFVRTH